MNALRNPQSAAHKMVAALQAVVDDKNGMTEETFCKVLGALNAAGVDPFPPPVYRALHKVSYYKDGKDWWVHDPKENTFLCGDDGDFARFETEEQAQAAIEENARQERELQAEISGSSARLPDEPVVVVSRTLFKDIVSEQPLLSDEFGSCVFCGSGDYQKYPSPNSNFYQHQENCDWMKARKIICESAGLTADVDGVLSPEEFRNYLRHRGFSLVSKTVRDRDQTMLFAYLPTEIVDERPFVDTTVGLEPYFVCVDDQALSLTFAQNWCDARLSGRPNIARVPDVT